jgi:hypothetical protein
MDYGRYLLEEETLDMLSPNYFLYKASIFHQLFAISYKPYAIRHLLSAQPLTKIFVSLHTKHCL